MQIETAHNVGIELDVAGLGDRFLAALIDYVFLGCVMVAFSVAAGLAESTALAVLLYVPVFLYFLLCEVFLGGQSLGKRLRGLRVARVDGGQPTLANYLVRWLLRIVEIDMTFGTVAFVTALVNGRGQRLGDLAAGTTVVRTRSRVGLEETLYTPVDDTYQPTFAQVDRLTDADVATAKDVLLALVEEGKSRTAFLMGAKMKSTLEDRMGVRSDLPPPQFLRTVIRDYNHLHGRL